MEPQHEATATMTHQNSVRFIPQGPFSRDTKKAIRSHVMLETRRKQRQQKQLILRPKPLKTISRRFEDTICRCDVLYFDSPALPETIAPLDSASRVFGKSQKMADTFKVCPTCRLVQFSKLSRPGQLRIAKSDPGVSAFLQVDGDPFNCLPTLPLVDIPAMTREMNELKIHIITFFTPGVLKSALLPIVTKDPAIFMGMLYMSAAYLSAVKCEEESVLARAIKKEAIRQINLRLSDEKKANTSETISAICFMSVGVWNFANPSSAAEVNKNEEGIHQLLIRGPTWWPTDALGQMMIKLLAAHKLVHAAMVLAPVDDQLVQIYGRFSRPVSDEEFVAESPLFCPRQDFYSLLVSPICDADTLQLLRLVRDLLDSRFAVETAPGDLQKTILLRYKAIKSTLSDLIYAPVSKKSTVNESCRLAALMTVAALETNTPFRDLDIQMVDDLKNALQKTDIGSNWGKMSGVLFWIALLGSSAATGKPQHRYMDGALRRVMYELTYKYPLFEAVSLAALNFMRLQEIIHARPRDGLESQLERGNADKVD